MDVPRRRNSQSRSLAQPGKAAPRRRETDELRVVSDLCPGMPVTQRELDLLALLLGDRLRAILEDDS
jgi:hypothetical protein